MGKKAREPEDEATLAQLLSSVCTFPSPARNSGLCVDQVDAGNGVWPPTCV